MRAITVAQPHAWAIIHGDKPFENRSWPSSYRGPLLIHAGKSREWLDDDPQYEGEPDPAALAFGAVIGVVEMAGCHPVARVPFPHETAEGPFCHHYRNPRPLSAPVPWRGAQGLWDPPIELVQLVIDRLPDIAEACG